MSLNEPRLSIALANKLKSNLENLSFEINQLVHTVDQKKSNLLNEFEEIHHLFHDVQVSTASYYLKSYLAPFTEQFEVISIAIQHLSERNHGALIVIQRKDNLENFVHSGIPIHAKLTFPLLETIFYRNSPLHDGAVLICNDKIISASNVLPVSDHKVGMKKLGTRHRAGIGLSEQTDALVLIVSEETGKASFALGGNLYPIMMKGL
ncbi:sporulation-specific diadenylate cyclase CdaS [Oceanobacillus bengalensis]|uniref:Diadenylate cyclase n=1 Tax=Oceanobacillus bengalensis TaxID=1435466 RepID=A0A494YYA2_9BACI|nr:sporulation-specific diadenylate cyclase CdaS [Oceanobacillus bengalensis]RKQ15210.1 diadenylate cyclase [Oceanobacillus bengalensis]